MKVDDIIVGVMYFGRGILMVKFDVQNVYYIVLVELEDRSLLGMKWQGVFYVDMVFFFGIRFVFYIFICFVDFVEWIVKQNYNVIFLMYYLDDFYIFGLFSCFVCQYNLDNFIDCFFKLGIFLYLDKLEGFFTCLIFFRIELDLLVFVGSFIKR